MNEHTLHPTLTLTAAADHLLACLRAGVTPLYLGHPGIGKSSFVDQAATVLIEEGLFTGVDTLIGSTLDPTDVGGFPVVDPKSGAFSRAPIDIIKRAAAEPRLLVLDEYTCAPQGVQATLLRLVLADGRGRRYAGDTLLHERTRVVVLANPPDQAPGGTEIALPTTGRLAISWVEPSYKEIREYFEEILGEGESKKPSPLAVLARDFAATLAADPTLLQIEPPSNAFEGASWASPRDVEHGLRVMAALGPDANHKAQIAALASCAGEFFARRFISLRKLREHLPTVEQIVKDPAGVDVPAELDHQIGAMSLIAEASRRDIWAAWVYVERLRDDIAQAASHGLQSRALTKRSKHAKAGLAARDKVMGASGRVIQRRAR